MDSKEITRIDSKHLREAWFTLVFIRSVWIDSSASKIWSRCTLKTFLCNNRLLLERVGVYLDCTISPLFPRMHLKTTHIVGDRFTRFIIPAYILSTGLFPEVYKENNKHILVLHQSCRYCLRRDQYCNKENLKSMVFPVIKPRAIFNHEPG